MFKKIAYFVFSFAIILTLVHTEAFTVPAEENEAEEELFAAEAQTDGQEDFSIDLFAEEDVQEEPVLPEEGSEAEEAFSAEEPEEESFAAESEPEEFFVKEALFDAASGETEDGFCYQLNNAQITITEYTGMEAEPVIPSQIEGYPVTEIGELAFSECEFLTEVVIPEGVERIGAGAFFKCVNLTEVVIPEGVTTISEGAFNACRALQSVSLPASLKTIEPYAFSSCRALLGLSVSEDNPVYTVSDGVLYSRDLSTLYICPGGKEGAFIVPQSVTSIADTAFNGCEGITEIALPQNLERIGAEVFLDTWSNEKFSISDENTHFAAADDILYTKDMKTLICCPAKKEGNLILPDGLVALGESCFDNCDSLYSVKIPEGVNEIGSYAFYWCDRLEVLELPSTLVHIGESICYHCSSLVHIYYNGTQYDAEKIDIEYNEEEDDCLFGENVVWYYSKTDIRDAELTLSQLSYVYTGSACEPEITKISLNGEEADLASIPESYYTIEYRNNINAGTATVILTIIDQEGLYATGSAVSNFTIEKASQTVEAEKTSVKLTNGQKAVINVAGAVEGLAADSDNTSAATVTAASDSITVTAKGVGTANVILKAAGTDNYMESEPVTIQVTVVPAATSSLKVANVSNGVKLTWKKVTGATGYKVYRGSKLLTTIKKNTTVTYTDKKAANGSKYTYKIVPYASCGDGKSKSVTTVYVARPSAKPTLTSKKTKQVTVKWKKVAKAGGYEICYSTNSKFSSSKTVKVKGVSSLTKTITKLKAKKKYYIKVRAYKTVSGKTYRSAWSAANSLKIK